MKQWDHDCAASERFQVQQAAMAQSDVGNDDDLSWARARAKLAKENGLIPCPDCGGGSLLGCSRCWDEGFLNADGSPLHDHANWDAYYEWLDEQQGASCLV